MTTTSLCPCGTNLPYADCCEPVHLGQKITETAEQLMRSRYSAFVLQNIDYIVSTTAPFQQHLLDKKSIADWAKCTDWAGLEIIKHVPKLGKRHAQVEFKALFHSATGKDVHHELSTFVKIPSNSIACWYFLDPTVVMSLAQKQPCPCGSSDKYKRCCGQFLN